MSITEEQFAELLSWLDEDPDRAALKYEAIRRKLITIFLGRQCYEAEDLADDTINRVARKVSEIRKNYVGDPARYFYGVARHIFQEYLSKLNKIQHLPPQPPVDSLEEWEPYLKCLDECLETLDTSSRHLILEYYREQKHAKIVSHKVLRESLNLKAGALRARICRIRSKLEKCVMACLERLVDSNDIA